MARGGGTHLDMTALADGLKISHPRADVAPMSWGIHATPPEPTRRELILMIQLAQACADQQWTVTDPQMRAIDRYCATGYEGVNGALRGDKALHDQWAGLQTMIDQLGSITPLAAPCDMTIYRGVALPNEIALAAGDVFEDPGFQSCSVRRRLANQAAGRYKSHRKGKPHTLHLLEIQVEKGQPIVPVYWAQIEDRSSYDKVPNSIANELEVMLNCGSRLLVDRVTDRADGSRVVRCRLMSADEIQSSLAA